MTLIDEIKQRGIEQVKQGKQPDWTDILLLKNIPEFAAWIHTKRLEAITNLENY